jgi:SAM-dependent methyltransferase
MGSAIGASGQAIPDMTHTATGSPAVSPPGTYAFGNQRPVQPERLQLLAELLDEGTFTALAALGVRPGWRCLEVGAGGGSVAAWLAGQVAPGGSVLATDLDTSVLRGLEHPCVEVRTHDILRDPIPESSFDLVHARLLLAWLADPQAGLARMAAALKPGGWLIAEEMDFLTLAAEPRLGPASCELFTRVIHAHHTVLADRHAFDPFRGRSLPGDLAEAGLVNTGCQGRLAIWQGGQPGGRVWQLTLLQLRDELNDSGLVTSAEVDQVIGMCGDPRFRFMSQATIASWGCRPP